ncbi:MAG: hypothetical protein ACJ71R_06825, partial [Nitrososphaeraceae archaeon]
LFQDGTWVGLVDVKAQGAGDRGFFIAIAAAVVGGPMHVIGVTKDGRLWHTIRHVNDTWDHFVDVKGQAGNPDAFTSVDSAWVA